MTVSETIALQFLEVRETGRTNMFDAPKVQRIAHERGLHALVTWIEDHGAGAVGKLVMGDASVRTPEGEETPIAEWDRTR
jgi:kynureninase